MHALQPSGLATVVIPALDEARRIGDVVRHVRLDPAVCEVFVVDDSSIDATASLAREAGARVVTSSMLGKGASMRDGVSLGTAEVLVFLDGDLPCAAVSSRTSRWWPRSASYPVTRRV